MLVVVMWNWQVSNSDA